MTTPPVPDRPARALGLLTLFCAALWLWSAGRWDLWGADETRYVQIAKELHQTGTWFPLNLFGVHYDQKPPLTFWIFKCVLALTGGELSSWALRMPSILMSTLSVLLTYLMGRRLFGERAGWIAAIALLASPQWMDSTPTTELNALYSSFITLSIFPWVMREPGRALAPAAATLMWVALAAAFFVKGPLAIVFVLAVVAAEARRERSWRVFLQSGALWGLPLVLGLIGWWIWAEKQVAGAEFVVKQVKGETLDRIFKGDHAAPPWFYTHRVFTSIFGPWALALIPGGVWVWRNRRALPRNLTLVVGWIVPAFIVLSAVTGKRQSYMMPLLPGMALGAGWWIDKWLTEREPPAWARKALGWAPAAAGAAALGAAGLFGLGIVRIDPKEFQPDTLGVVTLGVIGAAGIVFAIWMARRARAAAPPPLAPIHALAFVIAMGGAATFGFVKPALNTRDSSRAFAEHLARLAAELGTDRVGGVGKGGTAEFHVYAKYKVIPLDDDDDIFNDLSKLPLILCGRDGDWEDVEVDPARFGYHKDFDDEVAGDEITVYIRRAEPVKAE